MCTHRDMAKIINMAASGVPVQVISDSLGIDCQVIERVLDQYQVDYEPVEMDHYVLKPRLVAQK